MCLLQGHKTFGLLCWLPQVPSPVSLPVICLISSAACKHNDTNNVLRLPKPYRKSGHEKGCKPGMVVYTSNLSLWKGEAGESNTSHFAFYRMSKL